MNESEYKNSIGVVYIAQTLAYFIPYSLCIRVMLTPEFRRFPAYKIMLAMAANDIIQLINGAFLPGVLSVIGVSYLDHPKTFKIWGACVNAMWCNYGTINILLGLNRLIELTNPALATKLFQGKRTYWLIALSFVVVPLFAGFFFTPYAGLVYHSGKRTYWLIALSFVVVPLFAGFFFSPYAGLVYHAGLGYQIYNGLGEPYGLLVMQFWNPAIAVILPLIYIAVVIALRQKTKHADSEEVTAKEFFGSNCIIYLALNRSVRDAVLALLGKNKVVALATKNKTKTIAVTAAAPANHRLAVVHNTLPSAPPILIA